jgi:hypothetical protein
MQKLQVDCQMKIQDLIQMKTTGDTTQQERLMQERERLMITLNPVQSPPSLISVVSAGAAG